MNKLTAATAAFFMSGAFAGPIDGVSTTLYGDPRPGNPDGIEVSVIGTQQGTNEDIFDFVVDWTGPMELIHPDARMFEFYFNVNPDDAGQWVVSDVTTGWNVLTPATVSGGGNNTGFLFELDNDNPPLDLPLEFALQYLGGEIMEENFSLAPDWVSNDPSLTEGQLGAHIGGLVVNSITCPQGGCSDSGFAVGDWGGFVPPDPFGVPEPGIISLLSIGLIGLVIHRRKVNS